MERSTEPKATSDGTRLNRVQMARALREGAGAEDGRGAEQRMASVERNWSMDGGLRRVGARVTLGVLLASTLTGGRITALRADFLRHATAGGGGGGSIPGSPGPSVGSDGQGHSPIQDTNQEQQKKMFSKLTGVTAAIAVGASVTVAGAQNAAVQWRVSEGGNGHWYRGCTLTSNFTWSNALAKARSSGGDLASIVSVAESQWVYLHVAADPSLWSIENTFVVGPWIGGFGKDGTWSWTDGSEWSYTEWYPNEGDYSAVEQYTHYYSGIGSQIRTDSRWGNFWGEPMSRSYIVEWSADCNNDGTVDYGQILRGELPDINHNGTPDTCECIGDIYVDRAINGADLGALLAYWGPVTSTAASRACDLNGDGVVNGSDLGILLAYWGTCGN
jgi:hypothetical protein